MTGLLAWPLYGLRWLAWRLGAVRRRRRRVAAWVYFLLESPPPALPPPPGPLWRRFLGGRPLSLLELQEQLRRVAADPRPQGVLIQLRPMLLTAAQGQALAGLLEEVRASGKRVVCWATFYTSHTYPVACAAEEVLLAPGGEVGALGLSRTYMHLKEALARVGIEGDFLQISPYKTAADVLTKAAMTRQAREMAEWLADSAYADLVGAIARGRRLESEQVRQLIDASPFTDEQALAAGAVDALLTEEQLSERLGGAVESFHSVRRRLGRPPPPRPGQLVGLLRVEGLIVDGRARRPPASPPLPVPLIFDSQSGDLTLVEEARRLAGNRRVGAVILWIDSGGGSATASMAMASALRDLGARKPLLAVMGSVAASGGYEVATPARRIYAQPGTITGSIGVLGGKIVAGRLLDRLLVNRTSISRGEQATMASPERAYSRAERAWMRSAIERTYRLFLADVAAGRGRAAAELEPLAGGRVWTGRQALEHGLIDELGGLGAAVAEARRLAGLRPDAALREVRSRGAAPVAPGAGALGHAFEALAALERASAWLLCPWLSR